MARILIIDDDEIFSEMLSDMVERMDHSVFKTRTMGEGLEAISRGGCDVVFLDIHLPDGNGLAEVSRIREAPSNPEVIIITGFGDSSGAELALKSGVWDYISKPSTLKEMQLTLIRCLSYREEKKLRMPPVALKTEGIVGGSPQIKSCLNLVAQAAQSDASVHIRGDTGTGKEIFALAIHNNSKRAAKNFVVVDCASLPETLVESMLFGHERGAFTGAEKSREGLIKQAHGGTLFLDEIGELPSSVQKSFLRVLQERRFRPLGSDREIESDFRLISATNKELAKMAETGQFREDLLFRICTLNIDLPPLRKRKSDIRELLTYYVSKLCDRYGTGIKGFSPEFIDALMAYEWPGNVREFIGTLEKVISEALFEPTLYPKHLPINMRIRLKQAELEKQDDSKGIPATEKIAPKNQSSLRDFREEAITDAEKTYLANLLKDTGGDVKEICRIADLSRPRLYALMKKYGLKRNGI